MTGEGDRYGDRTLEKCSWYDSNTFHHRRFGDLEHLVELKRKAGSSISVCLPTMNEAGTVGDILDVIRRELMEVTALVDQLCVVDGGSRDGTREIAADRGAEVYLQDEIMPHIGSARGKGDALWKSLYCTSGDIVVWVDSDIENFHPRFVYGLVGPLLLRPEIRYVKAFYRRPIKGESLIHSSGGGRVTELVARPMLSLFYPELGALIQPLSGEYAGERTVLERVPFFTGYGVETGLNLDIYSRYGMDAIGQVDLEERLHRNQPLSALGRMSFEILQTLFIRLQEQGRMSLPESYATDITQIDYRDAGYFLEKRQMPVEERPPMIELEEYRLRIGRDA